MANLIDAQGHVRYGFYAEPVTRVNYLDYPLETAMGLKIPRPLRAVLANQFHFAGVVGPELMIGVAVVDLKYLKNGFVYVFDRVARSLVENKKIVLPGAKVRIAPTPEIPSSEFLTEDMQLSITHTGVMVRTPDISINLRFDVQGMHPLRLCTRAGYRGWVYMQKTTPIPVEGEVRYQGKRVELNSPSYWGLMDWTTGFMRHDTYWNWAATAFSLKDGRSLGLNLCCGVNETSFTENAFWIDGDMTKVDSVDFLFDNKDLNKPWRIRSYDGRVDLMFTPEAKRNEAANAVLIKSRFTQLMGTFAGHVQTHTGEIISVEGCPGWAEDHYARW